MKIKFTPVGQFKPSIIIDNVECVSHAKQDVLQVHTADGCREFHMRIYSFIIYEQQTGGIKK